MSLFPTSPFGFEMNDHTVIQLMADCNSWEDRYRQLIQLGKQLPTMPKSLKQDEYRISGCESQVWFSHQVVKNRHQFCIDSDARIVRGLIALVMAALNNKTSEEIDEFDIKGYFEQLGLIEQLSASRTNGLKAIVETIKLSC